MTCMTCMTCMTFITCMTCTTYLQSIAFTPFDHIVSEKHINTIVSANEIPISANIENKNNELVQPEILNFNI